MNDIHRFLINILMLFIGGGGVYTYDSYNAEAEKDKAIDDISISLVELAQAIRYSDEKYHKEVLRVVRKNETIIDRICK